MEVLRITLLVLIIVTCCNAYFNCDKSKLTIQHKKAQYTGNPIQEQWLNKTETLWNCNCNAKQIIEYFAQPSPEKELFDTFEPLRMLLSDEEDFQVPDEPSYNEIVQYMVDIRNNISYMISNLHQNLFDENQERLFQTLDTIETGLKPEILNQVLELLSDKNEKAEDAWFILDSESEVLVIALKRFYESVANLVRATGDVGIQVNATEADYRKLNDRLKTEYLPTIRTSARNSLKHIHLMSNALNDLIELQRGLAAALNDLLISNDLPI